MIHERRRATRGVLRDLALVSAAWGVFCATLRQDAIDRSPAWSAALSVVPWESNELLGGLMATFGFVALLAAAARRRVAAVGFLALSLAGSLWAVVAAAFLFTAAESAGAGVGFAIVALFVAWLHLRLSWTKR